MLSFGTDDFFAFCTASYSVGLPAGSGPPVRAATSMFLMSLANILPRLASMTAFLCLVVAHLEWPDIALPSLPADEIQEVSMQTQIVAHLGVERRRQDRPLLNRDDPIAEPLDAHAGEDLDLRAELFDPRRADEHRMHRIRERGIVD